MTLHEQAAGMSQDDIVALLEVNAELQRQVDWFNRQLFGSKSERRIVDSSSQLTLGESLIATDAPAAAPVTEVAAHTRRGGKQKADPDDTGLRFDDSVPVEVIDVPNLETAGLPEDRYTVVGVKETYRLAQRPSSTVILCYRRKVVKLKEAGLIHCPPAPPAVLEKSYADVSFLAGMLVDKFLFHLPLYRQHQRLTIAGVQLARSTLTNYAQRSSALLAPIYEAQVRSILAGGVIAMDETPIKASLKKKGRMKTGYYWPVYGDRDEVVFPYAPSRASKHIPEILAGFQGTLVTDGYPAYVGYVEKTDGLAHAQCWSHTRRQFVEAEASQPQLVAEALDRIAGLYEIEAEIRKRHLAGNKKLAYRGEHGRPCVDRFFVRLRTVMNEHLLLPSNPFTKAAQYALSREEALRVFLADPAVPLDTNHLEREIRPIALGRKNWLFCWTELGAEHVGVVQSLIRTCRLQGINPYTYLVDVLQRVDTHPASQVHELTPRLWREKFGGEPLRSDVERR